MSQGNRVDRANPEVRAELEEQEERVPVAVEGVTVEPVAREAAAVTEAMLGRDSDLEAANAVFPMIG